MFIDSEKAREHSEEEMIKIENIKGRLYVVGADDDSFWEAGKYIRRMTKRLEERPHTCQYVPLVYKHGTHFVLPATALMHPKVFCLYLFWSLRTHPDILLQP